MRRFVGIVLAAAIGIPAAPVDPREEAFIGARRSYWAFQPVTRPPVPKDAPHPVDAFLREAMLPKRLTPNPPADRHTLLRRLTLDLTGMPPTAAEMSAFLADRQPKAYERAIDRLLASPAYGERWALKWLDVVRYADTNGYELDAERPQSWRYRDYVIRSFQTGKPYDRFLKEQIAGDELYPGDHDALIATGFLRAGPRHVVGGNTDEEVNRQEVLLEMTLGVSNTFLGLTVGCARCHNHKFDPITQADHYRLQAIFAATDLKEVPLADDAAKARYEGLVKAYKARRKPLEDQIAAIEKPVRERLRESKRQMLAPELRAALEIPKEKRTPAQELLAKDAAKQIGLSWDEVVNALEPADKVRRAGIRKQLHAIEYEAPEPPPAAFAVANMEKAPETHILKIGDPKYKLDLVEPAYLTVLGAMSAPAAPAGRRAALAQWLADPANPLTARVMANRIWQMRMGTGLVSTPNDFGQLGGRPSHRTLLDWLASEFIESGWSISHLDRLIVTSAAYRQSAASTTANAAIDAGNRYFWRMNRRRLEGEALRDSILAASGRLNLKPFGEPVRTPIEPEIYDIIFTEGEPDNLWPLPQDRTEIDRKSIYLLNKRTVRLPMLSNFDQPDAITSCPIRPVSTHALQALTMLNSDFMQEQAQALATRGSGNCGPSVPCRVRSVYSHALQRAPSPAELRQAQTYLVRDKMPFEDFCKAMLNRHEFVYIP